MEHSSNDTKSVLSQAQAIQAKNKSEVLVRPPWNDPVKIKPLLDYGFNSLVIPMVNNQEDAQKAVMACHYPPKGIRGVAMSQRGNDYTRDKNYFKNIEENICLIPQLETVNSIKNISNISAVEGVTALFIGPADLSADMGILGQFDNKELWLLIEKAVSEIKKNNKSVGTLIGRKDLVQRSIDIGFDFVACGTDSNLLAKGSDDLLSVFKK
jgi:4-hydroxy-2-oxoheptanedioate aldolase